MFSLLWLICGRWHLFRLRFSLLSFICERWHLFRLWFSLICGRWHFFHLMFSLLLLICGRWHLFHLRFFFCFGWLSFFNHESSLHRVITWFLLIVCFCFFLLLMFTCIFYGWVPILNFYLQDSFSLYSTMVFRYHSTWAVLAQIIWFFVLLKF
jgi:hypothetical protein